jgi:hypothetical protein
MKWVKSHNWQFCRIFFALNLAGLAGLGALASPPLESTHHTDERGTLKLIFPQPGLAPVAPGRLGADNFLRAHARAFALPADLSNLELVTARESLLGTHYRYRQMLNGIPVDGADAVVSVAKDGGEVYQAYNNTYPVTQAPAPPGSLIGESAALDSAWNHLRVHGRPLGAPKAELVYRPIKGGFQLAYKTYVPVEAPFGYWEHRVDALTGAILSVRDTAINESKAARQLPDFAAYTGPVWPRTEATSQLASSQKPEASRGIRPHGPSGVGRVFDPDPRTYLADETLVDGSPAAAFTAAYVTRPLLDLTYAGGVYSLSGPWVTIADFEAPNTPPSTSVTGQWTALRGDNAFNDVMTYFHIDQNQRYLQSLGYTGATGIQYGSISADSDGLSGDDNSHYIPGANELAFGHGGVDDNEDADVILHEYGHAITFSIVPTWGGGDADAIGEGFGDYWGGSYSSTTTNGRTFHPEWVFSWDGHSADTWSGRWLDMTNLTYDSNYTYYAHETINGIDNYSDQLWSTPLFQSFLTLQSMGYARTNIDKVVLESFFGLGGSPTMRDLANATVNAAARLFPGGPYADVYLQKFLNQMIIAAPPVPSPVLLYPVGGETLTTGAVVQVRWNPQGAPTNAAVRLEYSAGAAATYSDNMENGANGWIVSRASGSTNWVQVSTSSHSPTHSWYAADLGAINDLYLRSPLINVGAGDVLSFWHSYSMESGFDGGVVEISTNGTAWLDLGSASTQNGYVSTISTSYGNPIGGRRAFTGSSGGYVQTTIPLTAYAGQSIYLRFRAASDSSYGSTGWWVDDVAIGHQWMPIGSSVPGATNYLWTTPANAGTNYQLRIQQFAPGYTDSGWVQSAPFTLTAAARPSILALRLTNGIATLTWRSIAGTTYRVQYKTNLNDATWLSLTPDILAAGSTTTATDQPLAQRRCYRIMVP